MINFKAEFPSFSERAVKFPVREHFFAANLSIAGEYALVNVIDQYWHEAGHFAPFSEGQNPHIPCQNLTYLLRFDSDLKITSSTELHVPQPPMTPWPFRGFECPRLFYWRDYLRIAACSHAAHGAPGARMFVGRIEGDRIEQVRHIQPNLPAAIEKNWMPEVTGDRLRFHYQPGKIISANGGKIIRTGGLDLAHLHGGSQVIPYGAHTDTLCVVHAYTPIEDTARKQSRQHFILSDKDGRSLALSEAFEIVGAEIEVVLGMAYHPNGRDLILSYGRTVADSDMPHQERPFVATVALEELSGRIQL